ncbi:LOB domain-containing protein 22 [Abrus precatorius]|uniref:LOB domain-containing protein 22 n=1 Tax=Abrus precatorius TaxID=3816 RepID=A0A8B8KWA3_ABRPR|nr:LOB domain-containing protein 22 [Abrus precatorius]
MQRNTNGMHPACAACKHQRKKCSENCILAPYFPSNRNREFHAVHRVFGVSNITKLVKNAKEEDRRRVVDSLIWEACCRQRDPIHGPYGEYTKVYNEYKKVLDELKRFRGQNHLLQLPPLGLKSVQDLIACNGTKGEHKAEVDNALDYLHGNKNGIIDSNIYSTYCSNYLQEFQNIRPEVVMPFQQHSQPYFIAGINDFCCHRLISIILFFLYEVWVVITALLCGF